MGGARGAGGAGERRKGALYGIGSSALPQENVDIHAMGKLADGSIAVLAEQAEAEKGYLFCSKDSGESFETTELSSPLNTAWLSGIVIVPCGWNCGGCGLFYGRRGWRTAGAKDDHAGRTVTSVLLELPESQMDGVENILRQLAFDSGGKLDRQDLEGTILWIDPALGACTKTLSCDEKVSYFGVVGDKLLCVTESGIRIYGTADGVGAFPLTMCFRRSF